MLVAERHQKIVELVNERKSIRVSELSNFFSVTEETIRRDLEKLEKKKKLARSHGGAVSVESTDDIIDLPYAKREVTNVKEKKEIALAAVKELQEGDKIILDASTTATYMAKAMPNMPLTVLTNSISVAMELSTKKEITLISTGGTMLPEALSFVGPLAEATLDAYHVNKAFISCKGLHQDYGVSESDEQQARIKKKMMDISDVVYILIDHSKFGVRAFSRLSGLDKIDHIITDSKVNATIVDQIAEKSLHVMRV